MLAKEIKIRTLKQQREFIEAQLATIPKYRENGNSAYRYIGHVYPEVIKYFESKGFVVTPVKSDQLSAISKGAPVYLFTVGDIELSEEELKQAEEYDPEDYVPDVSEPFKAIVFGSLEMF